MLPINKSDNNKLATHLCEIHAAAANETGDVERTKPDASTGKVNGTSVHVYGGAQGYYEASYLFRYQARVHDGPKSDGDCGSTTRTCKRHGLSRDNALHILETIYKTMRLKLVYIAYKTNEYKRRTRTRTYTFHLVKSQNAPR